MAGPSFCVALTGATGFVGRHVLPQLLAAGHRVRVLVHDPARLTTQDARIQPVTGDLFGDAALAQALSKGADAVVHLVGIIMEQPIKGQTFKRIHLQATQRLLAAAQAAGIKRWVHMSALGSRPDAVSDYHRTKWVAEEAVRASGMEWTIFRPSVIHGPDGEFVAMAKGFWCNRTPPFVPYFSAKPSIRDMMASIAAGPTVLGPIWPGNWPKKGDWKPYVSNAPAGRLQPVWVEDVATCFARALALRRTIGETYPLGGPEIYSWPQFFMACRRYLPGARPKPVVPIPVWSAKLLTRMVPAFLLPFNRDQVIMSQEDSICQISKAQDDFEIELASFEATFAEYAGQIS